MAHAEISVLRKCQFCESVQNLFSIFNCVDPVYKVAEYGSNFDLDPQHWYKKHVGRCTGMEGKIFSCIGVEENESEVLSRRPSAATTTMLWAGGCTAGARSRWADVAACMAGAHRRLTPPPALRSLSQPERTMAAYAGDQPRWSFCFKGYLQKS